MLIFDYNEQDPFTFEEFLVKIYKLIFITIFSTNLLEKFELKNHFSFSPEKNKKHLEKK